MSIWFILGCVSLFSLVIFMVLALLNVNHYMETYGDSDDLDWVRMASESSYNRHIAFVIGVVFSLLLSVVFFSVAGITFAIS